MAKRLRANGDAFERVPGVYEGTPRAKRRLYALLREQWKRPA